MIHLYRLLFIPALLAALPVHAARMVRRGGYGRDFLQRLGFGHAVPARVPGVPRVWIHAVSVGEVLAVKPLIKGLRTGRRVEIVLTTTTSTAHALAERELGRDVDVLAYFPLDFWPISRRVWESVRPDACVLMEAEIWPEHLHQASLRKVPVFLINARMSGRSYARWRRLPASLRAVFRVFHRVLAASPEDARRFADLGVPGDRVLITGNLKLDFVPEPIPDQSRTAALRRELGLAGAGDAGDVLVLAGASTWPGEEEMLLRVLEKLRGRGLFVRLLIVPRHAERRGQLRSLMAGSGLRGHFRSDGPAADAVDVYVADTTGEMVMLLHAADVVFVGKSMGSNRGGQNPIEAAALGKAVVFGPNMQNFKAVAGSMLEAGAALQVMGEAELLGAVSRLLQAPAARDALGKAALDWHAAGRGATQRTLEAILEVFQDGADRVQDGGFRQA